MTHIVDDVDHIALRMKIIEKGDNPRWSNDEYVAAFTAAYLRAVEMLRQKYNPDLENPAMQVTDYNI